MSVSYSRWFLRQNPYRDRAQFLSRGDELAVFRKKAAQVLDAGHNLRWHEHLDNLKPHTGVDTDFSSDCVRFGREQDLTHNEHEQLVKTLQDLIFWRKGPFEYFGTRIDAEWQSNIKWNRVMELIAPGLSGKTVLDIGCNNMYYMYRMLCEDPSLVIGIEPLEKYIYHYYLNSLYYPDPRLHVELMGIDDLGLFEGFFDLVFCMGILYHRRNPLYSLEIMAASMKKGARLVLETAGIPGNDPVCLFPGAKYMMAPGWWFLPTWPALENMLARTGFTDICLHGSFESSVEEQRVTPWTTGYSLADFLDPSDLSRTIEGYPAPVRFYVSALRRG